ncbi:hypothetical protein NLU13_1917 [Sarocladium strictum]|uniref:Uncharacterized protein n=1 Tax=Sarocladium strictum TaxID=5046 RepID=A0AA39GRW5_SARSR|nr:hypothetical protein NLU13_1917 [Sarocladium strictum]
MAPASGKANYKTYEAQARLVRAMVAAHPTVKWDYKEIAACYGSDMTKDALNHRFRHLKAEALIIEEGRKQGFDMRDLAFESSLPGTKSAVNINEIAKYFGQSTADGIQFQFRTIKKDAEKLRQVQSQGGDVASALTSELQSGSVTPSAVTPSKATPRRRAPASGSVRKRSLQQEVEAIKHEGSDEDWDDIMTNLGEQTPSKRPKVDSERTPLPQKRHSTASGSLPIRLSATPGRSARGPESLNENSQSTIDLETPLSSAPASNGAPSIFGPVSPKASRSSRGENDDMRSAFKSTAVDAYVGSQNPSTSMYTNASFSFDDGEI